MTEHWERQQLPRSEIEKMRQEVKQTDTQLDDARRKLIEKKSVLRKIPKNKKETPPRCKETRGGELLS